MLKKMSKQAAKPNIKHIGLLVLHLLCKFNHNKIVALFLLYNTIDFKL